MTSSQPRLDVYSRVTAKIILISPQAQIHI